MNSKNNFKIILAGDARVGKSNILQKFVYGRFNEAHKVTIGVEFAKKEIQVRDQTHTLMIWDTCGEEKYRALTKSYYYGSVGALLVFDITDRTTFDSLSTWIEVIRQICQDIELNAENAIIIIVGNKTDLNESRQVSTSEAAKFAFDKKKAYIETSALTGSKIQETFEQLASEISKLIKIEEIPDQKNKQLVVPREKSTLKPGGCC